MLWPEVGVIRSTNRDSNLQWDSNVRMPQQIIHHGNTSYVGSIECYFDFIIYLTAAILL